MANFKVNPRTGLVVVKTLVEEAGLGLRVGEIRGVPPETAEKMIAKKHAVALSEKEMAEAKAEQDERVAARLRNEPAARAAAEDAKRAGKVTKTDDA